MKKKRRSRGRKWEKWHEKAAQHPRYGVGPSAPTVDESTIDREQCLTLGPNYKVYYDTAISADLRFQEGSYGKKAYYVDLLRMCEGCQRPFIYFALEHKYRVEVQGKYFEVSPRHCFECRCDHGRLIEARKEFDQLVSELTDYDRRRTDSKPLTEGQWQTLITCTDLLLRHDKIEKTSMVERILRRANGAS